MKPTKPSAAPSVGEQLQARRIERGLDLHDVELATKIRGKYLRWIEADDYRHLPHDIYSKGFVTRYAAYLGLNTKSVQAAYMQQRGSLPKGATAKPQALTEKVSVTSRWLASLGVLAVLAGIIGYLVWQFSALTAPPSLRLSEPATDGVVTKSLVEVRGVVSAGADVTLNGSPLLTDVHGAFRDTLALQPGINNIRVVARSKLGKETVVERNLLSKPASVTTLPTTVFEGVAVEVRAAAAGSVTVTADGRQTFSGTVAAGSVQIFQANKALKLILGDASAVKLRFTNQTVAGQDYGDLGSAHVARTIELGSDTQVVK